MKLLRIFGKDIILGSLIAILSVMTALASWQGSIADSNQNKNETLGMQNLNDGNAEYLSANQFMVYDYTLYDSWYTTEDETKAAYFEESYSDELVASIEANPDDPFNNEYYNAMYAPAYDLWDESDANFEMASQYDDLGDALQLVMLFMAVALAFAAWASLLKEESNMRPLFAIASIVVFVIGLIKYLTLPVVG
jgi:type II secretory pathway pseudopilin PulG